jgi:hypothetical protein
MRKKTTSAKTSLPKAAIRAITGAGIEHLEQLAGTP